MREERLFKIASEFAPMGDQPQAIETLAKGVLEGKSHQTLMGVTGSGKTFTMANIIEQGSETDLGDQPQQDSGSPASRGVQGIFPAQRGGVFCLLLRLLSAGSLRSIHGHLH